MANQNVTYPQGGSGADANALHQANNLSDLSNVPQARTNLGLGTSATHPSTDFETANTNIQAHIASTSNPHGTTAAQVGITSTDNISEGTTNKYYTDTRADTRADGRISAQKAAASGLATLDGTSKIPMSQMPAAMLGAAIYQGAWNASTNSPALASATGTKGYYYVVTTAGTTNLDGITDWQLGDWAIYNGTAWQKVDNTDAVLSVNGATGTVVLTTSNIAEGTNQYHTDARVSANTDVAASKTKLATVGTLVGTSESQTLTNKNILQTVQSKTATYTAAITDDLVLANGTFTVTLPSAVTAGSGKQIVVKNTGTGTITVGATAGTLDGSSTKTLALQYESATFVSDGSNWFIT